MTKQERAALLQRWIKPSSESEQTQQARAETMVRKAIKACSDFNGSAVAIYTKGSYPNNTNVRQDSDVDVVVELLDCIYYNFESRVPRPVASLASYSGPWTPDKWRSSVRAALVHAFGGECVHPGKIAIKVDAVAGSRPSADVVPSFKYLCYNDAQARTWDEGSCVFPSDGAAKVVNWPTQQLEKGRKLNTATGGRYKNYVRALKNAENVLAKAGVITELPSYFMECLVFNASSSSLTTGDLDDGFQATLVDLWEQLKAENDNTAMVEPNWMKYLFQAGKKWTVQDGKDLVQATWNHLGY